MKRPSSFIAWLSLRTEVRDFAGKSCVGHPSEKATGDRFIQFPRFRRHFSLEKERIAMRNANPIEHQLAGFIQTSFGGRRMK
jgi:hypothetical protein